MKIFGYDIVVTITKNGLPSKGEINKELEKVFLENSGRGECIYPKIEMIKRYRELSREGLKESRDFIEGKYGKRLDVLCRKHGVTLR